MSVARVVSAPSVMVGSPSSDEASSSGSDEAEASDSKEHDAMHEKAKKVRASFNAPAYWVIAGGMLLAMCAGAVNVTMLLRIGKVVSHTTGHLTAVGLRLEGVRIGWYHGNDSDYQDTHAGSIITDQELMQHVDSLTQSLIVIVSFVFGSFLCGLVIPHNVFRFGGKSFYGFALIMNSLLLGAGFLSLMYQQEIASLALTSCAMGLQNAMCTMHLGAVVRTTHVTGTSTDIGSTLGRATMILLRKGFRWKKLTVVERAEVEVDLTKMRVLVSIFFSFGAGCFVGAWLYSHLGYYTLLVPANVTFCLGVTYMCFRDSIKRRLKELRFRQLEAEMQDLNDVIRLARQRSQAHKVEEEEEEEEEVPPSEASSVVEQTKRLREDLLNSGDDEVEHVLEMLHDLQEDVLSLYENDQPPSPERRHLRSARKSLHP